ncbi:secretory lipase-domain-containing protein [Halteromyces radiatus]|uniref:secretory lipase-domain-containing protein n=1 Tax=Halteromyces radiatus TaxID=101107 RepID=UPI0022202AE6|nr:secretory lipase-domain-containing protein [Halteromyces radiatus]KAI8098833.1 secretory lipase-domain-containing protein [Halteromyces radiatus]
MLLNFNLKVAISLYFIAIVNAITTDQEKLTKQFPYTDDPFFIPPSHYTNATPGTILRIRASPIKLAAFAKYPQNIHGSWQILFRTTDSFGAPDVGVTTLMAPHNADNKKLVSFHIINDAVNDMCAASAILELGAKAHNFLTQPEIVNIDQMLHHGWYVSIPNYAGSQNMYTVGLMVAHGVLDSLRSVVASGNITGMSPDAEIQMFGYSGGAMASGWAAQEQVTYAPELNIIGSAMGGTPRSLNATINAVNKGLYSGLILTGITALARQYPELYTHMQEIVRPEHWNDFVQSDQYCLEGLVARYAFLNVADYMKTKYYLDSPMAKKIMNANDLGNGSIPTISMYMFHSLQDDVVPFDSFYPLYERWCAGGANIMLTKERYGIHTSTYSTGFPAALNYMIDTFDGKRLSPGCTSRTTVSSLINKRAWGTFRKIFRDARRFIHGAKIGPNT